MPKQSGYVNVPRTYKTPGSHKVELAYITKKEAKKLKELDLHNSGIGKKMHYGPKGIPNYNGGGGGFGGGFGDDRDAGGREGDYSGSASIARLGETLDWGMGPEGSAGTIGSSRAGEDRDFGDDVSLQQKTAFMATAPVPKPTPVAPVTNITNYLEDTTVPTISRTVPVVEGRPFDYEPITPTRTPPRQTPTFDPSAGVPGGTETQPFTSGDFFGDAEDEATRREVIASLANRRSNLLNRIPGGGMSVLEAAGLRLGRGKIGPRGFIDIGKEKQKSGGYYSPWDHRIMMSPYNMSDPVSKTRVASHELGHSAWSEASRLGMLEDIPFSRMEDFARQYNINPAASVSRSKIGSERLDKSDPFAFEDWKAFDPSTLTLEDMHNAVSLSNKYGINISGTYPVGHERLYNEDLYNSGSNLRQFDPRMRTAGYMNAAQGKTDYEDWVAYQRELPDVQHGGARVPNRAGYETTYASSRPWLDESYASGSTPWGPATIWEDDLTGMPVKTGGRAPFGYKEGRWSPYKPGPKYALNTEAGWDMSNWNPATHARRTGLGNWPMGDEHALLDASTASYPMASGGDFYGNMARYNRYTAKNLADPRSRISTMHRQGLPRAAVRQFEDYLANNPWISGGGTESSAQVYDEIQRYLSRIGADDNLEQIENVGGG